MTSQISLHKRNGTLRRMGPLAAAALAAVVAAGCSSRTSSL